jgi:hypothetical protein
VYSKQLGGLFGVAGVCSKVYKVFVDTCSVTMEQSSFGIHFPPTYKSQYSAIFISTVYVNTLKYMVGKFAYLLSQISNKVLALIRSLFLSYDTNR